MLEFGQAAKDSASAAGDAIKDGSEETFLEDVVEASREVPVVVDFWAPWCAPCKTLGPMLERAVAAAKGRVRMVKIDVDRNRKLAEMLARQGLPIQSIPAVVAFYKGQVADMFQGALPESEIKAFIDRIKELAGGGETDAIESAEALLAEGAAVEAAQIFAAILRDDPENPAAFAGMARAHVAMGDLDQAEAILNGAPAEIGDASEIEAVFAQIRLARQAANVGPASELRARVDADPGDHEARFELAQAMHAGGDVQGAIDELLELFRRDREWNDGAAKKQLLTIFEAAKPQDPIALDGRRRLSSLIFA